MVAKATLLDARSKLPSAPTRTNSVALMTSSFSGMFSLFGSGKIRVQFLFRW
jgi:hypothetical protein